MVEDIIKEAQQKMKSAVGVYEQDLLGIRGGRASTSLVDRMTVDEIGVTRVDTPAALNRE